MQGKKEITDYLATTHQDMIFRIFAELGILPHPVVPIELRPMLTNAGITADEQTVEYMRMFVNDDDVSEDQPIHPQELASKRLSVCHETGHIVQSITRPDIHRQFREERNKLEQRLKANPNARWSKNYSQLFDLGEACAEFTALAYIDLVEGIEKTMFLLQNPGEDRDNYGRVWRTFLSTPKTARLSVMKELLYSDYQTASTSPRTRNIFTRK